MYVKWSCKYKPTAEFTRITCPNILIPA